MKPDIVFCLGLDLGQRRGSRFKVGRMRGGGGGGGAVVVSAEYWRWREKRGEL